jgi:hypothetical protein
MMPTTFKATLVATALALLAGPAAALPQYDIYYYTPSYVSGSYSVAALYNGSSSTLATSSIENTGAPLTQLGTGLTNFYWSIRDDLTAAFASAIGTQATLTSPGGLWGDINMSISGQPDGTLKLAMNGLSYNLQVSARKSDWTGTFTCNSSITLNGIAMSSVYNPYTGAVTGTTISYTPTQSTSCDSSYSWIPFIGSFIDNYASSTAGRKILESANGFSGKVLNVDPQKAFFSFSNAIQPGANMIGGFDAGMYIKNNMQNLYIGKTVSVFIANQYKWDAPFRLSAPGAASYSGKRFSIMFSDANSNVGVAMNVTKNYKWVQRMTPGTDGPGE